jgi:hypothetical protein
VIPPPIGGRRRRRRWNSSARSATFARAAISLGASLGFATPLLSRHIPFSRQGSSVQCAEPLGRGNRGGAVTVAAASVETTHAGLFHP